jgi:cell division protein FtsI/penicillin-binding protein 2
VVDKDSWFVAYAPPTHPTLLVAARLERVRDARLAASVVRDVLSRIVQHESR